MGWLEMLCLLVLVHAGRIALLGNPMLLLVRRAPAVVYQEALALTEDEEEEEPTPSPACAAFIRRVFWNGATAAVLFVVELGVIMYLISTYPALLFPWVLLAKNLFAVVVAVHVARQGSGSALALLAELPAWAVRWERVSYLITAMGFAGMLAEIYRLG